ncbi:cilia- and flagella-associated protein 57 [Holotrichia oblita]|uniref:Cilia- and flagella-associated protein 57 n=1 Tax=Holotrichia oblita TaxID=644536 RepID=A0ACB9SRB4_HOLOL|nr:cilia- and flagella-associated protein 57 [Holotrichia oblita]
MAIPVPQPRLVLGLQTNIKGNAQFINDEEVIYPVGGVLCVHNFYQRRQKFIKLGDKGQNVTSIAVSPNRRIIAIAESGEKPFATLFDAQTCKKRKQILLPADRECSAKEFAAMGFTADSKSILVVTGDPEWALYLFKSNNPTDSNLVVLVGNQLFRMLACSENSWRQFGFCKADQINITCAAWITQDRLLAGTIDGRIMALENGEIKAIYTATEFMVLNFKVAEGGESNGAAIEEIEFTKYGDTQEIRALFNFNKGFAYAHSPGTVYLFEKETPHKYRRRNIFKIPDNHIEHEEAEEASQIVMNEINFLSINISEDRLLASCNETQLYVVRLWGQDLNAAPEIQFQEMGMNLHHGPIGGMAVCAWKPIFITSGAYDRTLRIWNFENETLELYKKYLEDIHGLDLHPTGLFTIVGFSDKLRFLTILMDDFSTTREFPVRNCKLCSFSNLGHLFAAANGNVIQVYSSISFEHMFNLKGHNGRVTGISWMHDDYKMVSCGTEGAVYEWQISTTRRISETIIKSCQFADVNMTNDGKSVFAVGSDGRLREIMNCNVHRDVMVTSSGLDTVLLSNSDLMLFVTGNSGVVFSVKLPVLDNAEYQEYTVHSTKITHTAITYDDKYLITCSHDGCIVLWRLLNIEGKAVKLDKEFTPSTEILIGRGDLEEKFAIIKDLQLRMHELETEHAYQMRQSEALHNATIKDIHEGYCSAIEELKEKNEQLEIDHMQEINNINTEITKLKSGHEVFVQTLESNYNEKLIVEYEKYIKLEEKMDKMRIRYDKELEDLHASKKESETNITNNFIQKLNEKEVQLEEVSLIEESKQRNKEHELIKQQIEDDADREIYEIKTTYEKQLTDEQDANVRLKGETQIIKKKLMASQKEIEIPDSSSSIRISSSPYLESWNPSRKSPSSNLRYLSPNPI